MRASDYLTLGVKEVAVFQGGSDYAFVQATVHCNRVPEGDATVEVQFWQTLQEFSKPHPGELFCSGCGDWRPDDYFPLDSTRKARRGRAYHCTACKNRYAGELYANRRTAASQQHKPRKGKELAA